MKKEEIVKLLTPMLDLLSKFDLEVIKHDDIYIDCETNNADTLYNLLRVFSHSGYKWDVKVSSVHDDRVKFTAFPNKKVKLSDRNLEVELAYKCCMLKSVLSI